MSAIGRKAVARKGFTANVRSWVVSGQSAFLTIARKAAIEKA
jgi:hypothetical protein